ncbi:uncharacterized protein UV8b_01783 [Ustilaginoidea virens]|uniref:Uncharacterized protein n=1 Tax=Ustilaginoidea virens TaxID=1159556 RepID=A0A8E5MFJ8_USTVR|nr:uncharacterized protein UV8b_01783 [Ustilaginoidea virens]QUC17542.1 hypothetical protein UV8b_01783 [Ustilaginoidea virens]
MRVRGAKLTRETKREQGGARGQRRARSIAKDGQTTDRKGINYSSLRFEIRRTKRAAHAEISNGFNHFGQVGTRGKVMLWEYDQRGFGTCNG